MCFRRFWPLPLRVLSPGTAQRSRALFRASRGEPRARLRLVRRDLQVEDAPTGLITCVREERKRKSNAASGDDTKLRRVNGVADGT